jgi:hypothetical protein
MSTQKQIEANRLNAQKSTGPRTPAGKSVSRMNALKTGIDAESQVIRGESAAALAALTAEYYDRYQPATPEHRALVDTLISSDWLLRRLRLAESQLWEHAFERMDRWDSETEAPLGEAFSSNSQAFSRLQRRIDSADRNYHRALKELRRLQPPAAPHPDKIGFVPQASPTPAQTPPPAAAHHAHQPSLTFGLRSSDFGLRPSSPNLRRVDNAPRV